MPSMVKGGYTRLQLVMSVFCIFLFQPNIFDGFGYVMAAQYTALNLTTRLDTSVYDIASSGLPAIAAYSGNESAAYFLPILSSPSFNSSDSSLSPSAGFSLGSWYVGSQSQIRLALCGGLSGSNRNLTNAVDLAALRGQDDLDTVTRRPPVARDGYAVPVWYANLTSVRSLNASLKVVQDASTASNSKQLQLVDYDGTVYWSVSNVEAMEIDDSGVLSIYNEGLIWESSSDILFKGQKLMVGRQLLSGDSTYIARMEEGGLMLLSNSLNFMGEQPAPYLAIPAEQAGDNVLNVSANLQRLSDPPCSRGSAYVQVRPDCKLLIAKGPCKLGELAVVQTDEYNHNVGTFSRSCGPLSFMKLENTGRLVIYAVSDLVNRNFIDAHLTYQISIQSSPLLTTRYTNPKGSETRVDTRMLYLGTCANPGVCGPYGLCASTLQSTYQCTCPLAPNQPTAFVAALPSWPEKGCNRTTPLPSCIKDEHVNTTDFLELNHMASIFLFSGLGFHPMSGKDREFCRQFCSSDCSCNGFFYQVSTASCLFMTDEMSFIDIVTDYGLPRDLYFIQAQNYVTYLKKVKLSLPDPPAAAFSGPRNRMFKRKLSVIVAVSSTAFCLLLGLVGYLFIRRRSRSRRSKRARLMEEELALRDVLPLLPTRFSFDDLHLVTEGFSKLIGAGGCGSVYAGMLPGGRKVAVKTLELTMKGHSKEFLAEVATIGQTNHQNIVRLVGFCWEHSRRLLVYEYMERGSLDMWLFKKRHLGQDLDEAAPVLDWRTRYDVVLGIVRGLCYLHEECSQPILHFDIKPQNILLDGEFVAKLADFGMSRLMQRDVSQVVTQVRGTPGYIAPEWLAQGAVSKKSDVYSLGMVMLEIIGGRRNVDLQMLNLASSTNDGGASGDADAWYFPSWAASICEQGSEMDVVDKRLTGMVNEEEVKRLIYTAFWCIQEDPGQRPYAPTILQWLEGADSLLIKQPPFGAAIRAQYRTASASGSLLDGEQHLPSSSASAGDKFSLDAR